MTPAQCRAGRALLSLEQSDLSGLSGIARPTIIDFEKERRSPRIATIAAIRAALEAAGVVFLPENGNGPGVALRKV